MKKQLILTSTWVYCITIQKKRRKPRNISSKPNHDRVALGCGCLGDVYRFFGDLKKAKDYNARARTIRKNELGLSHPKVANSYQNLGAICYDEGDLNKAMEYYKKALEIREKEKDPDQIAIATLYLNFGHVYYKLGKLEEAKDYHQRALELFTEHLGQNHKLTATANENLNMQVDL